MNKSEERSRRENIWSLERKIWVASNEIEKTAYVDTLCLPTRYEHQCIMPSLLLPPSLTTCKPWSFFSSISIKLLNYNFFLLRINSKALAAIVRQESMEINWITNERIKFFNYKARARSENTQVGRHRALKIINLKELFLREEFLATSRNEKHALIHRQQRFPSQTLMIAAHEAFISCNFIISSFRPCCACMITEQEKIMNNLLFHYYMRSYFLPSVAVAIVAFACHQFKAPHSLSYIVMMSSI